MCKKCGNNGCQGCGDSNAEAQLSELQDSVDKLTGSLKAFLCGNPILLINTVDDVSSFDLTSGKGSGCWEGWAIMNGATHFSTRLGKNVTTGNFIDRFIPMAGGSYVVGDLGGADSVVLTTPQLPVHNHAIIDPGHSHNIVDPGHNHAVTDPGHNHAATSTPHNHTFTTNPVVGHEHSTGTVTVGENVGVGVNVRSPTADPGDATSTDGAHSHTGVTDDSSVPLTTDDAFTGLAVNNAFIGITETESDVTGVTTGNTGAGEAHENRPPYFATLYVMLL